MLKFIVDTPIRTRKCSFCASPINRPTKHIRIEHALGMYINICNECVNTMYKSLNEDTLIQAHIPETLEEAIKVYGEDYVKGKLEQLGLRISPIAEEVMKQ